MKIIVVEDNLDLQQELVFMLGKSGHSVTGVSAGPELDRCLPEFQPDIVLLDVGLPGEDGFSIARRLRSIPHLGIVMLTARGSDEDHIQGLEGGADNYLTKPVNRRVLLAVLERVYNRLRPPAEIPATLWKLQPNEHLLISPSAALIPLTDAEQTILETLMLAPGKTVSRRQLIEALGYDYLSFDGRRLEVRMSRLRKKIRDLAGDDDPLKSEWGIGYIFTGVTQVVRPA